jgi:Fur family ferric uptake transcriptional regulator
VSPGEKVSVEKVSMYDTRHGRAGTPEIRLTRQRVAVAAVLQEADAFLTAQEVHALLRDRGEQVGLATVYRCLQNMASTGQLEVLFTGEGEVSYLYCSTGRHHHHLICRNCGRAVEVEGPGEERWADRVAAAHGYVDVSHTLEIFGVCRDCANS